MQHHNIAVMILACGFILFMGLAMQEGCGGLYNGTNNYPAKPYLTHSHPRTW